MKRTMFAAAAAVTVALLAYACGDSGTDPGNGNGNGGPTTGAIAGSVVVNGSGESGVTVGLNTGATVTTNSAGQFEFTGLEPATYTLTVTPPAGTQLSPGQQNDRSVAVAAGGTNTQNFALLDPAEPFEVRLSGVTFTPSDVTIVTGMTVRWIVVDGVHSITPRTLSQPGVWPAQDPVTPGDTFEHTFNVAGQNYDYFCRPHEAQGMTGVIRVPS